MTLQLRVCSIVSSWRPKLTGKAGQAKRLREALLAAEEAPDQNQVEVVEIPPVVVVDVDVDMDDGEGEEPHQCLCLGISKRVLI